MIHIDVPLGRKFNNEHQIAILLARHLGRDEAEQACQEMGLETVREAFCEQDQIVTIPA